MTDHTVFKHTSMDFVTRRAGATICLYCDEQWPCGYQQLFELQRVVDEADMMCSAELMKERLAELPIGDLNDLADLLGRVMANLHGPKMDGPRDDAECLLLALDDCVTNILNSKSSTEP